MKTWRDIRPAPTDGEATAGPVAASVASRPALSLEDVYRRHFEFVYRKAARLGGPGFDAEDAAQDVFMIVARKLDTFDGSSEVTTWLFGITLNVVRAARRRAAVRRLFARRHVQTAVAAAPVADPVEVQDAHRIAWEILDRMSAKHREAFVLFEFEGMTCEEIARVAGTRTETVWSRLHYARKEFAERLRKRGPGGGT